ncbi:type II secretion system F family protein [Clostridium fallax]|uniref:Type II secretion system protein F (GspF) n=1 Tax=Clostridium fallax TaxID=1533 RepID=A0A1M4YI45_9CLOT|nr:type II secretion system F family protein [Clostridium fallax]SHF05361.1 type II secretion system protein F (GspF) [Clostridium fallax]SQB06322.1 pilus biogenesis protein [Clostridium fallax]
MNKFDYKNIYLISSNLSTLNKSGINIEKSFHIIKEIISKKSYKKSLERISKSIYEGNSLGDSFQNEDRYYPSIFLELLKVGEYSGHLDMVLEHLGKYYKDLENQRNNVISSLIYPIILIISLMILVGFSFFNLIPSFIELYDSNISEIPSFLSKIYDINLFMKENINLTIILIILYSISLIIFLHLINIKKLIFNFLNKSKIYNKYYEKNLLFLMYTIMISGIPILTSINKIISSSNEDKLRERLIEFRDFIEAGGQIWEFFDKPEYSKSTYLLIRIGEESGKIEIKIKEAFDMVESSFNGIIKTYLNLIQPIMISIIGIFIGITILIFIVPIYSGIGSM